MQSLTNCCIKSIANLLPESIITLPIDLQDKIIEYILKRSAEIPLPDKFELLFNNQRIKLDLSSSYITDDELLFVAKQCQNLKFLDLSFCPSITNYGLEIIMANCTNLIGLSLKGSQNITEKIFDKMNLPELRYLDIGLCNMLDESIIAISNGAPKLSCLILNGCWELSDDAMFTISLNLRNLEHIDLSDCNEISMTGIQSILLSCSDLKYLILKNSSFVNDSELEIVLQYGKNLTELGTHVSSLSLEFLKRESKNLKLQTIYLHECNNIQPSDVQSFQLSCPNLNIQFIANLQVLQKIPLEEMIKIVKLARVVLIIYFILNGCKFVLFWIRVLISSLIERKSRFQSKVTVAITGGRSPFTLELCRMFHENGVKVITIESSPIHLCRFSRSVSKNFLVPKPNQEPEKYANALASIVASEKVDLLISTCEEVFWVSKAKPIIQEKAPNCKVFAEDISTLMQLHSKWFFAELIRKRSGTFNNNSMRIPNTKLITNVEELMQVLDGNPIVLKPCFSRFAAYTVILPQGKQDPNIEKVKKSLESGVQWVAQQFINGKQLCTFSVSLKGKVLLHTCYAMEWIAGDQGASICWKPISHPTTEKNVQWLMESENLSGMFGFDFIEQSDGTTYVIECNPRATSGIHLFGNKGAEVTNAYLSALERPEISTANSHTIFPDSQSLCMISVAMILYCLPKTKGNKWKYLRDWLETFLSARDAVWKVEDPLPFLGMFLSTSYFFWLSFVKKIPAVAITTYDIEWNGQ